MSGDLGSTAPAAGIVVPIDMRVVAPITSQIDHVCTELLLLTVERCFYPAGKECYTPVYTVVLNVNLARRQCPTTYSVQPGCRTVAIKIKNWECLPMNY